MSELVTGGEGRCVCGGGGKGGGGGGCSAPNTAKFQLIRCLQ